jgi:hypothetical protein
MQLLQYLYNLLSSGLMESIKQLRETLMIQEWDLHSRHHAKQKCAERFAKVAFVYHGHCTRLVVAIIDLPPLV